MAAHLSKASRPAWPRRAVVTAGMPYGNKNLHFGHVGGVFIPADFYARFLRDRLGAENVLFVSGTDCYGSPIMESYRKLCDEQGYTASIADYVQENHDKQAATLAGYGVEPDFFGGSALAPAAGVHERVTDKILHRLKDAGVLHKRSTLQFFDTQAGQFLNGRQVIGRCPIQGCKSEKAYADECDLGHQFEPEELIAPISQLTGTTPELRPVDNLYFDLPAYLDYLKRYTAELAHDGVTRSVVVKTMEEWLGAPQLYIQTKFREAFDAIETELPEHTVIEAEGNKSSFTVQFPSWRERDEAHEVLNRGGVRFRSGKALVPFRITGNIEWGVPVDDSCGCSGLTCWVWPESLWAPISFTRTALAEAERAGAPERYSSLDWHDWWCSPDAHAYQFIGQDNIYFYGVAQTALWEALGCGMQQSTLVANYHVLYMGKKASSSSKTPPPPASELLEHYRPEQLRAHFLSLGLGEKPVSFSPKAYDTRETGKNPDGTPLLARDDKRVIDPVLKEGALLTGVFNRLARSCFYGVAEKEGDESRVRCGCIPAGTPAPAVIEAAEAAILSFEDAMHRFELHRALGICDAYLRAANKRWSDASKAAKAAGAEDAARGDELMHRALVDAFHELHVATVLMHGIVPEGCELICEHFAIAPETFFSWEHIFDTMDDLARALGEKPGGHRVKALPPRFDFFSL
ncbi:class I tRNA ligase family protein [Enorma burkinafasonensis]|uniref:class I tRNA ligase family protein n=1 Tax=Enorma burkinafasonensis TaxID=2590867 RepID=UPI0011A49A7E|nr:class I tRNA ligase family protein [Enorma burkinafasonensis]